MKSIYDSTMRKNENHYDNLSAAELKKELEKLRLRNQELEASERIKAAIYRIAEAALEAEDLDILFRSIHTIIGQLIPAKNIYIALYDEKTNLLSFPYFVDEKDDTPAPKPLGRGMTEYVLRTGRPLLAKPEVLQELHKKEEIVLIGAISIDWLGVPLKTKGKTFGVLTVQTYTEGTRYNEEDKNILEFVSAQVAMAIERKKAGDALKKSEKRYRRLIENQGEGTAIMSPVEHFIQVNPAAERIFGVEPGTLAGLCLLDFLTVEDQELIQGETGKRKEGNASVYEHMIVRPNGEKRCLLVTATPDYDENKVFKGAFVIFRDITDRKKAERDKRKLEEQLRQSQKMEAIGTLAGGIAHDFNNILSAIIGYSELALDMSRENPELSDHIDKVLTAGNRAKDLVKQILAFSRKDKNKREPLIINETVRDVLKLVRPALPATIEIRAVLDDMVFPIFANPTQVHRVILNLCTNAAHAMKKNGGILEITTKEVDLDADTAKLKGVAPGVYQRLCLSDTGKGMPPDVLGRIFEPYFTTKKQDEGTGMGLAVVHGIVKNHGGDISVYSEPAVGTRFQLLFPVTTVTRVEERRKTTSIPRGSEHIMWIDDDPSLTGLGTAMLSSLGYRVTCKNSGLSALEAFRAAPRDFDLVVTDQTMPKMTGIELARQLKEISPHIPILLTTGFSREVSEKNFRAHGFDGLLMKPLLKKDLAAVVRIILDQAKPGH